MKVWHMIPYSVERNLGASYNQYMALIPDGDTACFMDGDAMHLIPDWGHVIQGYAERNPNTVLTCWINRIHELAVGQKLPCGDTVEAALITANGLRGLNYCTARLTGTISGTLLVIPKHIWQLHPFAEVNVYRPNEPALLGIDNEWTNRIRKNGVQILRMDSLLIYHQYRLMSNGKDKTHLL